MSKILVLGASGQIGTYLCEYIRSKGNEVIEFDILNSENQDLRIHNNNFLDSVVESADFIYFLAFDIGGANYIRKFQNTYQFLDNNSKIMINVFESIKKYNKPFVFASSTMAENALHSSYGCLKKIGEYFTKSLNGIVVKFWNVYGIDRHPDTTRNHVICDFIQKAKTTGKINMMTDGNESRQFLYSEDCCEALYSIQENYKNIDKEKNLHITTGVWSSISDVAKIISMCIPCEIEPGSKTDDVHHGICNEPDDYVLNFWKPKTSLQEGISKIIESMQ